MAGERGRPGATRHQDRQQAQDHQLELPGLAPAVQLLALQPRRHPQLLHQAGQQGVQGRPVPDLVLLQLRGCLTTYETVAWLTHSHILF